MVRFHFSRKLRYCLFHLDIFDIVMSPFIYGLTVVGWFIITTLIFGYTEDTPLYQYPLDSILIISFIITFTIHFFLNRLEYEDIIRQERFTNMLIGASIKNDYNARVIFSEDDKL